MLPGPSPACLLLVHSDGEPEQGTGLVKPNERGGGESNLKKKLTTTTKKKPKTQKNQNNKTPKNKKTNKKTQRKQREDKISCKEFSSRTSFSIPLSA